VGPKGLSSPRSFADGDFGSRQDQLEEGVEGRQNESQQYRTTLSGHHTCESTFQLRTASSIKEAMSFPLEFTNIRCSP
jgi:hypothetical protein